jgi:hypothetical protein
MNMMSFLPLAGLELLTSSLPILFRPTSGSFGEIALCLVSVVPASLALGRQLGRGIDLIPEVKILASSRD